MNNLTAQDAHEIFLQALSELSEPLKSAVEFTLANWYKLNRERRPSDIAINFFASLPALPTNDIDKVFAAKLNNMAKLLRDDPDVWLTSKICRTKSGATLSVTKGCTKSATSGASKVYISKVGESSGAMDCIL